MLLEQTLTTHHINLPRSSYVASPNALSRVYETKLESKARILFRWLELLYSGKFLGGPNFRDFRNPRPKRENKNREI